MAAVLKQTPNRFRRIPGIDGEDSNDTMDSQNDPLRQAVIRLHSVTLGLVFGIVAGVSLFVATNFLVLKGGAVVGPHLSLLSQFFPGYRVTVAGSFVGFAYAFLLGFAAGFVISRVYNLMVGPERK